MNILKLQRIQFFLYKLGYNKISKINEIKLGINSKIYKIEIGKKNIILKLYCDKKRLRIKREYKFYNYLAKIKSKNVAKLIAINLEENFALYTFLNGKRVKKINENHIYLASRFINQINKYKKKSKLPLAVDGIESRIDHLRLCARKINQMKLVKKNSFIDKNFFLFLQTKIIPTFNRIKKNLLKENIFKGLEYKLIRSQMIISPSDFGFHNIIESNNRIFFYDFEYAGLDDPIKLLCDFYCQPDQKINKEKKEIFKRNILSKYKSFEKIDFMIKKFLPLHQLKWCCIILNVFQEEKMKLRNNATKARKDVLQRQLIKAKDYFKKNLEMK